MDWSYIAGFFDGEGCVSIGRNNRPICTMAQSDGPHLVLEKIQEFLRTHKIRSSLCVYATKPKPNHKPSKTLIITASYAAEDFLQAVLPFLVVKKPKAEQAIELLNRPNLVKKAREDSTVAAAREYESGLLNLQEIERKYSIGRRRMLSKLRELGIRKRHRWENGSWRDKRGRLSITKHHVKTIRSMPFVLFSHRHVAQLLNCHPSTIDLIMQGKTWRNLENLSSK